MSLGDRPPLPLMGNLMCHNNHLRPTKEGILFIASMTGFATTDLDDQLHVDGIPFFNHTCGECCYGWDFLDASSLKYFPPST